MIDKSLPYVSLLMSLNKWKAVAVCSYYYFYCSSLSSSLLCFSFLWFFSPFLEVSLWLRRKTISPCTGFLVSMEISWYSWELFFYSLLTVLTACSKPSMVWKCVGDSTIAKSWDIWVDYLRFWFAETLDAHVGGATDQATKLSCAKAFVELQGRLVDTTTKLKQVKHHWITIFTIYNFSFCFSFGFLRAHN